MPEVAFTIERYWSDQFPDTAFNCLPYGAGSSGSHVNPPRILMATREDGFAHARAELGWSGIENQIPFELKVRFAFMEQGRYQAVGSGVRVLQSAHFWTHIEDTDDIPDDLYVIAWLDIDGDEECGQGEPLVASPGRFSVLTPAQYQSNLALIRLAIDAGQIFEPFLLPIDRALAFVSAFAYRSSIHWGGQHTGSPIAFGLIEPELQASLNYHVGLSLEDAGSPTIRNFFFGPNSGLAEDVRNSDAFRDIVTGLLDDHAGEVLEQFPDQRLFTWPLPGSITYGGGSDAPPIDYDLHFVFNSALLRGILQATVACQDGQIVVTSLTTADGALLDLYDFDYGLPLTWGHRCALLQAGFESHGEAGQIFRTEVRLDGQILDLPYTFGVCKDDLAGQYSGSYTIELSGCSDPEYDGSYVVDAEADFRMLTATSFEGDIVGTLTIDGVAVSEFIHLIGTVDEAGALQGASTHRFFDSGGEGTFTGRFDEGVIQILNEGRDTYGDTCSYIRDMKLARSIRHIIVGGATRAAEEIGAK